MGVEFHITVNTPLKDGTPIKNPTSSQAIELFRNGIEQSFATVMYQDLAKSIAVSIQRQLMICATFFQRVVSRTPMDENYVTTYITKNGEEKHGYHKADENFARYDWQIECDGDRIISGDLMDGQMFKEFNSKNDINTLFWTFMEKFGNKGIEKIKHIRISNFNDHFATLEYGGYKTESHISGRGERIHGVENERSIYAPNGMLRITEMELQSMASSGAVTSLSKRFKNQRTTQQLDESRIKRLAKLLMKSGTIDMSQLENIIGKENIKEYMPMWSSL